MNEANFANSSLKQLLIWYLEAGVDESIGHNPVNRLISEEDNHEIGNRKNQLQKSKNQTITTNLDPTETTVKSANAIAKAGNKKVYIQYISPSGELLKSSHTPVESTFSIVDSTIHSTILDSFDYNNKEIEMCVDWQRGNMLESGRYSILIYIEEKLVGTSTLKLN